ncbi:MAG TPA: hypothetical protein DCS23_02025 [Candidatus Yonathbacteria bacterium]|nr:hypothetical protein [Candidatus Yonathbacteria bacterium]
MKKILISLAVATLIVPQIALASWWNPFSWKIFSRPAEVRVEQTHDVNFENKKATTTATSSGEVSQQKEVATKKSKNSVVVSPKKQVTPEPQVAQKQDESKTSIVTFQNGAVAEIDARGNVVRWIKEAVIIPSVLVQPVQTQISQEDVPALSILLRGITNINNSGRFSWRTNIPANSRLVLYTYGPNSVTFFPSSSGYSTEHFVDIPDDVLLTPFTHGYSVEAWDNGVTVVSNTTLFHSQKVDGYVID